MYDRLRGVLCELSPTRAVLDVHGVGYLCRIPLSTYEQLKGLQEAQLLTHLVVREDDLTLFGFATDNERELFRLVLSVTGVGPAIGLAALSALTPCEVAQALADEEIKTLQRIKGVGRKLAERLALELRERVPPLLAKFDGARETMVVAADLGPADRPEGVDALRALVELGYDHKIARQRIEAVFTSQGDVEAPPTVEDLVRACLQS